MTTTTDRWALATQQASPGLSAESGTAGAEPAGTAGGEPSTPVRRGSMIGGARWMSANQVVVQATRLLVQIVMARLLDPNAFGLMAMAFVVLLFLEILRGFGTGMAVVQRRDVGQKLLSSIFFFNIGLGAVMSGVMALGAPGVAAIYGDPELTGVLQVLSLSLVMMSFGDLQQWLLRREMKFASVATANITGAVAGGACAIVLGVIGYGIWSLVIGNVFGFAVNSLIAWIQSPWRPSLHFRFGDVRQVMGFSANLSGFNVFNFMLLNGDKIIVGRFLGAVPLGFYGLAQRVLMSPVTSISTAMQEVMFAGLSRIQDDHAVFRQTYYRACAVTAMVAFPAMVGLAVVAEDAVLVVLGEQWRPLIPLIWILAPIGGIQSVSFSVGVIYTAKGRTDLMLRWGIFSGLLLLGSYFVGLPWGVNGVAAAYSTAILLLLAPGFVIPFRLIDARLRELVVTLWPHVWTTLVTAGVVALIQEGSHVAGLPRVISLATSVAAGVLCYSGLVLLSRPPALADLLRFIAPGRTARSADAAPLVSGSLRPPRSRRRESPRHMQTRPPASPPTRPRPGRPGPVPPPLWTLDVPSPLVDPETGLWTAQFLCDRLAAETERCARTGRPLSLALVRVPDAAFAVQPYRQRVTLLRELGHQLAADGLDHLVHVPDRPQHWFAVVLPNLDRSRAQELERRLRRGISSYLHSRRIPLPELQSASLTTPGDDPTLSAIWNALARSGRGRVPPTNHTSVVRYPRARTTTDVVIGALTSMILAGRPTREAGRRTR